MIGDLTRRSPVTDVPLSTERTLWAAVGCLLCRAPGVPWSARQRPGLRPGGPRLLSRFVFVGGIAYQACQLPPCCQPALNLDEVRIHSDGLSSHQEYPQFSHRNCLGSLRRPTGPTRKKLPFPDRGCTRVDLQVGQVGSSLTGPRLRPKPNGSNTTRFSKPASNRNMVWPQV